MSKNIKTRIQNKHDLEVNWLQASFIPLIGELIVYDIEVDSTGNTLTKVVDGKQVSLLPAGRTEPFTYERVKMGDGVHTVNELPFITDNIDLSEYAKKTDLPEIPTNVSAFTNDAGYLTQHQDISHLAKKTEIPTKVSQLTNDEGYLTEHQSLAEYAKKSELPTVPTNVSAFTNDAGYLTEHQDISHLAEKSELFSGSYTDLTDKPSIPSIAGLASESHVSSSIASHNTNNASHNDIRLLITELTTRLNTVANSTDVDLDQLSEIVAYIKNNKSLIDGITTSKINVSDIINNLTTNVANKPLSAAQGVALKALIDALQTAVDGKSDDDHTHNYAGSSSAGGAATSANKLNTNAGSVTQPVYFANGVPVNTSHTLEASVPANAKFTDTVYTHPSHTAHAAGLYKVTVDGSGHVSNATAVTKSDITGLGIPAQDTTYSAGTGISLNGTTFSNSGVRSVATGTTNGTISVNTNGASAEVAVKGLGSAAYTASTAYDAAGTATTAANTALASAKSYTDSKVDSLISCGTADPSTATTSQFYFKYATN